FAPEPVFLWTNFEFFVYFMILPIAIISAATYAYRKKKAEAKKSWDEEELEEVVMEIAQGG
ncbi:MAG: hypothetical protein ACTSXF_04905, partial [Promethearchaeota archaeon]